LPVFFATDDAKTGEKSEENRDSGACFPIEFIVQFEREE